MVGSPTTTPSVFSTPLYVPTCEGWFQPWTHCLMCREPTWTQQENSWGRSADVAPERGTWSGLRSLILAECEGEQGIKMEGWFEQQARAIISEMKQNARWKKGSGERQEYPVRGMCGRWEHVPLSKRIIYLRFPREPSGSRKTYSVQLHSEFPYTGQDAQARYINCIMTLTELSTGMKTCMMDQLQVPTEPASLWSFGLSPCMKWFQQRPMFAAIESALSGFHP